MLRSPNSFGSKNDSSAPYSWLLFFRVPPQTQYTAKRYRAVQRKSCWCLAFTIPYETVRFSSNSHSIYVCVSKNRGILRSVQLQPIEWLFHWVILSYEAWDTPKYCWLWLGLQGWQFRWERGPRLSRTDETNTTLFPTQQTVTNYLLVFCLCPLSPTLQFTRLA